MFRFPNTASDIEGFLHTFRIIYPALHVKRNFNIDGIKQALADNNRISGGGYVGQAAVDRVYNEDRSRDGAYNGAKLYAELYRQLGWLQSPGKALTTQFSWFGAQASSSVKASRNLLQQALLGLVTPNAVLQNQSGHRLRPFSAILRTAGCLGGMIHRDEMIVGPLSLSDDLDRKEFDAMVQDISGIRGDINRLEIAVSNLATELGAQVNTLRNYTRFPIAALKWTGWFDLVSDKKAYDKKVNMLRLTDLGWEVLELVDNSWDVRLFNKTNIEQKVRESLIKVGFYQTLQRADFDISDCLEEYNQALLLAGEYLGEKNPSLLFSPFQELSQSELACFFPNVHDSASQSDEPSANVGENQATLGLFHQFETSYTTVGFSDEHIEYSNTANDKITLEFLDAQKKSGGDIEQAVELLFNKYQRTNKGTFYHLVGELFTALGYNCHVPTSGIHADRADATLVDEKDSIPIEIKSPGEEDVLSIKAIRQAVENKVILLSRENRKTIRSSTSLVVGNKLPGDRAEISLLIQNFFTAFGVTVGIIDFRSLLMLVARTVLEGKSHDRQALTTLYGFINVDPI